MSREFTDRLLPELEAFEKLEHELLHRAVFARTKLTFDYAPWSGTYDPGIGLTLRYADVVETVHHPFTLWNVDRALDRLIKRAGGSSV